MLFSYPKYIFVLSQRIVVKYYDPIQSVLLWLWPSMRMRALLVCLCLCVYVCAPLSFILWQRREKTEAETVDAASPLSKLEIPAAPAAAAIAEMRGRPVKATTLHHQGGEEGVASEELGYSTPR